MIFKPNLFFLYFVEETQQEQPSEKPKAKAKSEEKELREKQPANTKLDLNKLRSVVQRNILDNDRRQQKAEARKTAESSRLEVEAGKTEVAAGELENLKAGKSDNCQHVETENGPSEKKKKKKKRRQDRPDCLVSQRTLNCDSKSEEFDSSSSSKPNAGNRFSRVAGPREKPR